MRVLAALIVLSPLWAQGISRGLRARVPIPPVLAADGPQQASAPRFTIGPLIEVHLWRGAALGADFLLRRTDLAFSPTGSRSFNFSIPLGSVPPANVVVTGVAHAVAVEIPEPSTAVVGFDLAI